jgi:hypothetical protein
LSAVADTVKRNPVPALVIGAGIAWLIYESRRSDRAGDGENYSEEDLPDDFDRPLNYPLTGEENFEAEPSSADKNDFFVEGNGGAGSTLREKVHEARDIVREKIDRAREGASHLRERAGEIGSRVQDRTRELYTRSRDRVAQTANEKPLAVGLGVLALGITVGLALPTPQRVNRIAGPTVDRLRRKVRTAGQDYVERGRRVARAASDAAHGEAQKQGLTFEALRGKTGAGNASQSSSQQAQPQSSPQQQTQPRGESVGRNPSGSGIEGTSPQNMQNDRPSGAPAGASVSAPASDV